MRPVAVTALALSLMVCACRRAPEEQRAGEQDAEQQMTQGQQAAELETPRALPDIEFVSEPPPAPASSTTGSPSPGRTSSPTPASPSAPAIDDEQIARLRAAVIAAPADAAAHRRLAVALHAAGRKLESIEYFEAALQLDPGPRSLFDLGRAYASVSRYTEAEAAYKQVLALAPGNARALNNLGNLALKRGRHDRAIDYYRQAIEADLDYLLAYFNLGDALTNAGLQREAYAVFLTIVDRTPSSPFEQRVYNDAIVRLASLAISLGNPRQAEELLVQLLAAAPDHSAAHYARGQALLQLGREEEAGREFEAHMAILSRGQPAGATATAR